MLDIKSLDSIRKGIEARQSEWEALPESEKQKRLEEEQRREAEEKERAKIESYNLKGIPPRYYGVTWDNWEADTDAKQKAIDIVKTAWGKNLFLSGNSGTGKTHLAFCLTKDGATYRRLPDIFREVRQNMNDEQNIINSYGSKKLLIIDEVGRQKFTDFEKNLFFEIIDKRWNNILPITLITNMSEREFAEEYGTAIIDRLRPTIVRFTWGSKRDGLCIKKTEPKPEDIDF
jgi:DNA replication protein DnaC